MGQHQDLFGSQDEVKQYDQTNTKKEESNAVELQCREKTIYNLIHIFPQMVFKVQHLKKCVIYVPTTSPINKNMHLTLFLEGLLT